MLNRREMLTRCSTGFGMLALQGLMSNRAFADAVGGRKLKAKAKQNWADLRVGARLVT